MNTIDELLAYFFDGQHAAFRAEFEGWVRSTRRFKAFAIDYRSKIRTKLKSASDDNGLQDLRAELATAFLLLGEDRFTLEYEKYAAAKVRGPDFTAIYKTHTPLNIEVRRLRSTEMGEDADSLLLKLMAVLCDKIGQMPPGIINLLWLQAERPLAVEVLAQALVTLRQRADRKDEDFFKRRGFASAADFLKHDRQLSAIVVHGSDSPVVWHNPTARHKLAGEIANAISKRR